MTEDERLRAHEGGIAAMAHSLRAILDGAPCLMSEPPELAEVAELRDANLNLSMRLNAALTAHQRNEDDAYAVLFRNRGHYCDFAHTVDALMQRSRAALAQDSRFKKSNVELTGDQQREQE